MSFSADIKEEILDNKGLRGRRRAAFAWGLYAFSKERAVYPAHMRERVDALRKLGKAQADAFTGDMPDAPENAAAFVSGAFVACGNITNPEKSYHIEFFIMDGARAEALREALEGLLPGVKTARRRGGRVLYYKEHEQVEDLLTLMGAPKACLSMIDVEIMKSMRNTANRATNCETANLGKLVDAAAQRLEDIALVLETIGEDKLPETLLAAARLQQENPEASIRELAAMSEPKISRSGLFHRLNRISQMAAEIRDKAPD